MGEHLLMAASVPGEEAFSTESSAQPHLQWNMALGVRMRGHVGLVGIDHCRNRPVFPAAQPLSSQSERWGTSLTSQGGPRIKELTFEDGRGDELEVLSINHFMWKSANSLAEAF